MCIKQKSTVIYIWWVSAHFLCELHDTTMNETNDHLYTATDASSNVENFTATLNWGFRSQLTCFANYVLTIYFCFMRCLAYLSSFTEKAALLETHRVFWGNSLFEQVAQGQRSLT